MAGRHRVTRSKSNTTVKIGTQRVHVVSLMLVLNLPHIIWKKLRISRKVCSLYYKVKAHIKALLYGNCRLYRANGSIFYDFLIICLFYYYYYY